MPLNSIKLYRLSLLTLGFSSLVVQIIAIRQMLTVFEGNELIIGLAMGTWMLLTGLGALLSFKAWPLPYLHLSLALSALLLVILVPYLRPLFVTPGMMAGLDVTMLVLLLALAPFCIISGMTFPVASALFSKESGQNSLHRAYALESIGSIAGGLLFSLVMVFALNTWQSIMVVMILNLGATAMLWWAGKKIFPAVFLAGAAMALMVSAAVVNPLTLIDSMYYRGQEILEHVESPFGKIVVTDLNGQKNIYLNGVPLGHQDDVTSREENVHYAMLTNPKAKFVLMISGGTAGAVEEVLKYPDATIDYLEIDPDLLETARKYHGFPESKRVNIISKDPVRYLGQTDRIYDAILQNAPDPSSGLLNRIYTAAYFKKLKEHLAPDGVLQVSLSGGANYLNDEALQMHSVVYKSLKAEFKMVGLVPGGRNYFLAGDNLPNKFFAQLYDEAGIENQYVNPNYINDMQLGQRSRQIMEQMDPEAGVNTDIKPIGYYLQIREWLNHYGMPYWLVPALLLAMTIVFLLLLKPLDLGLFTGGYTAAASEFILLIWLQAQFGYVYQMAGLVFAFFMAGLAIGSWIAPRMIKNFNFKAFLSLQGRMVAFVLVLVGFIYMSEKLILDLWLILFLIFGLTLIAGGITGLQYATAVSIRKTALVKNASRSYSADLAGSAIGAMLFSVFCIPVLGIYVSMLCLVGFGLLVILILFIRKPAISK